MKLVVEAAVLMGVVTPMGPVMAPTGTVAVICVAEFTANTRADVPLKVNCVAPVRLVPVMTTVAPIGPVVGEKLVMMGGKPTKNGMAEVAVPVGAVMVMRPVVLPAATMAVSWVADTTVKLAAAMPLKTTAVTPVKFEPSTVTTVPAGPLGGEKLVMVGPVAGGVMVKLVFEMSKK